MNSSRKFWEKIYQENAPKLIGICRRYVSNNELAEDLVHDAFLTAIDKQSTYSGRGSFEGWLRQIVVNTALMYLRKEKNQKENRNLIEIEEKLQYANIQEEETLSIIEEAQFTDTDLLSAIDCLPFHHKLVFNLYVIDDYTHKQIAQKLNISEGTSKSHLARARKKIQDILYHRAASKQKKEKTRAAVLIPVIAKAGYIDSLFKSRMENFSLTPVKNSNIFLSQINWSVQVKPLIFKKQFLNITMQVSKYVILPVSLCVVVVYSTSTFIPSEEEIKRPVQEISIEPAQKVTVDSVKTIPVTTKAETINHPKQEFIPKKVKTTAVIVKRTIVQKQTVKVQKTVQIYDTTDAR